MSDEVVHFAPLTDGSRYRVYDSDCCLNVAFEATLLDVDDDNGWPAVRTVWDNGVTLEGHGEYDLLDAAPPEPNDIPATTPKGRHP